MKDTQKPVKGTTATGATSGGFTDEERGTMKERAQELKAAARRGLRGAKAEGGSAVLEKLAEMTGPDRALGKRLHAVIKSQRARQLAWSGGDYLWMTDSAPLRRGVGQSERPLDRPDYGGCSRAHPRARYGRAHPMADLEDNTLISHADRQRTRGEPR